MSVSAGGPSAAVGPPTVRERGNPPADRIPYRSTRSAGRIDHQVGRGLGTAWPSPPIGDRVLGRAAGRCRPRQGNRPRAERRLSEAGTVREALASRPGESAGGPASRWWASVAGSRCAGSRSRSARAHGYRRASGPHRARTPRHRVATDRGQLSVSLPCRTLGRQGGTGARRRPRAHPASARPDPPLRSAVTRNPTLSWPDGSVRKSGPGGAEWSGLSPPSPR